MRIDEHREERPAAAGPEFGAGGEHFAQHAELVARHPVEIRNQQDMTVGLAPRQIAQAVLERVPVAAEPVRKLERLGEGRQDFRS